MALPYVEVPLTAARFNELAELGVFPDDLRAELIDGRVVEMTPIGDRHALCVRRLTDLFAHTLPADAMMDVQNPVILGEYQMPQPDLVILRRRADAYPNHPHAGDILLLIEVADSSLAHDRDTKLLRYARAGIPEVWLVNLPANRFEVCREPRDTEYTQVHNVPPGGTLTPLHLPGVAVNVADILK